MFLTRFTRLVHPDEAKISMWVIMGADCLLKKYREIKEAKVTNSDNKAIRLANHASEREIPTLLPASEFGDGSAEASTEKLKDYAEAASQFRQGIRWQARELMADITEVALLQKRDRDKYENEDGPNFEQLTHKYQNGKHDEVASALAHLSIYHSSQKSDPVTDLLLNAIPKIKNED